MKTESIVGGLRFESEQGILHTMETDEHTSQEVPDDNVHADLEQGESSAEFVVCE